MRETWVRLLGWRSPREGKGYPLQYSGLENFMDCVVHGVAKNPSYATEQLEPHFTSLGTDAIPSITTRWQDDCTDLLEE